MNGIERIHFKEIDSTNNYIKTMRSLGKDVIVTAEMQTGGRGTKGRSFLSRKGGVYLSSLSHFQDFPTEKAFKIMIRAAVAVCKVLEKYDLQPVIKWPNDIHVNGKKICGILIENTFSAKYITSSIVGIGLNVNNVLSAELVEIATTMQAETGGLFDVEEVTQVLINELQKERSIDEYRGYVGYMGKEAVILLGAESKKAVLRSVDEDGSLWVELDGKLQKLTAAEVSLRL